MRTIVITGGTDGMGAALARHFLSAGDRVAVIGRSRAKFDALLAAVGDPSAVERAEFVAADLSLMADSRRVVAQLTARFEQVNALVLAASYIRRHRHVTAEGHEASWALFFLSKHLLVTGLAEPLRASGRPVIANTSVPGAKAEALDFDDPELTQGFTFGKSNAQQRRANELLGILATRDIPDLSYVTWGPAGLVRSSFAGEVGAGMKIAATILGPLIGQQPDDAVRPLIDLIDNPTPGRAAYRGHKPVPLVVGLHDEQDATRLGEVAEAAEDET
ncbi:short chain dehydrogenase [Sinosporangium album]|uniref:Short chain dehydrogenase n=1 Tax=Sinosporangium album TaxID=504805 RepID=A0A1G8FNX3_9ACTN|nr:SDR family NAD(P)-dependent oxidoreductase [Sinosporangium album]SDH83767.1 short chain dehydrogenase [Sinosporangium album]